MKEKGYYYDDGKYCEIETGPSFEDFPGMAQVVSPIPLCDACKKSDFDILCTVRILIKDIR